MARLLKKPYPLPELRFEGNWDRDSAEHMAAYKAIPQDRIVRFPRGDGYAQYFVVSTTPPVLQWIPFMDAWQVEPALIRGLRTADLELMLEQNRRLDELFGR